VLALGKLGGNELNYSSDIDLVFVADDSAQLETATRLARTLTHALSDATGEGFLYRVDLRLRPYGGGGAIVVSAAMLEEYLATTAHPAERQAMLKARPIAGNVAAGEAFLKRLSPVLFSDAAAARRQVRELKARIERQLIERGDAADHVKLGPGGIRDAEFLIQALQLESGAARPEVITVSTLDALDQLTAAGLLVPPDAHALREAYVVFRLIEHRLQLMDNRQVHRLPDSPSELHVLAGTLGIEGPNAAHVLREAYREHSQWVRAIFERVLSAKVGQVFQPAMQNLETGHSRTGTSRQECLPHVADLLARIREPADVELFAQRESHQRWTVTVALWDHLGVLSLLAGLFTAHRVDIVSGDVVSLCLTDYSRTERHGGRSLQRTSRKALDTFVVHTPRWVDESFWQAFRDELAELARCLAAGEPELARERIADRVSESAANAHQPHAPLVPVHVEVDNDALPGATQLSIRSTNTLGFLYEFAAALATLNVNIQRVRIRTTQHDVHDTFWVTDARARKILEPDRIHELRVAAALIKQFTHLLPRSPNPAQALRQVGNLARQMLARPDWVADLQSLESDAVLRTLAELMGVSQFLWEDFLREQHENLFPVVRNVPALDETKTKAQLCAELSSRHTPCAVAPNGTAVVRGSPDPAAVVRWYPDPAAVVRGSPDPAQPILPPNQCHGQETVAQPVVPTTDDAVVRGSPDPAPVATLLNQFKDREMFRIDLRHITRRIGLVQFSQELTDLAEVVIDQACRLCHQQLHERFGSPLLADGRPCAWCVCGLGKFGGRELGFASDVELIFVYEREGQTSGANPIPNSRYFEEFVSLFLQTLAARSEGIFEIDLRLRPHGKAGSLACSLEGFTEYFSTAGEARQFERLALVKLRSVAGDLPLGDRIIQARDEFVYAAQPLDYENILHLRQRQAAELVPPRAASAKHSLGGLVDLEYFVQARQIEFGRANPSVRATNTLEAIDRLHHSGDLPADQARELSETYQFLRRLIEALRVVRGHAKDLTIPGATSRDFAHLARRMHYDSPATLTQEIDQRMAMAQKLWSRA
jgi:glutamine synthetase adenylyltransferase